MLRAVLLVVAAFVVPSVAQAQAPRYVQITGVVGGSQLSVKAVNQGGNYVGLGQLKAPTGQIYNLTVKSGAVLQNRYVTLQGVITAPNGATTPFTLNGDRNTGGIAFMYTGSNGTPIKQTTIGTVTFFQ